MIVTVTERGSFKRCRRQWSYRKSGIRTRIPQVQLDLGSVIHAVMAEWSTNAQLDPYSKYIELCMNATNEMQQKYRAEIGTEVWDKELDKWYTAVDLGQNMIKNYIKHWGSPIPEEFELVSPEQQAIIQIPGTNHQLEATIDALLKHKRGTIWVDERKTYSYRPKIEDLQSNDQFIAYLWVIQQLDIGEIGGIHYDGMWKKEQPPRGSTMSDLFLRKPLIRSQDELQEFEDQLVAEVNDMAALEQEPITSPRLYTNRAWNGCWDCQYNKLCTAQSKNEDFNFILEEYYIKENTHSTSIFSEMPVVE